MLYPRSFGLLRTCNILKTHIRSVPRGVVRSRLSTFHSLPKTIVTNDLSFRPPQTKHHLFSTTSTSPSPSPSSSPSPVSYTSGSAVVPDEKTSSPVTPVPASSSSNPVQALLSKLSVYSQLGKPNLTALVVVTTAAGFVLPGHPMSLLWCKQLITTTIGTTMTAMSANSYNMIYERDLDRNMARTANRPLPAGKLSVREAQWFCGLTGVGGIALLAATANPLTAVLGASTLLLYTHVYTPMKQKSSMNTYVGAVVGSIPPLMGWASATGTILAVEPLLLFSTLFLWQLPHFASIAWLYRRDYKQAGYEMWSKNDVRGKLCSKISAISIGLMVPIPIIAYMTECASSFFLVTGLSSLYIMIRKLRLFSQHSNNKNTKQFLLSTILFLPVFLGLWYIDVFWNKCWEAFNSLATQMKKFVSICSGTSLNEGYRYIAKQMNIQLPYASDVPTRSSTSISLVEDGAATPDTHCLVAIEATQQESSTATAAAIAMQNTADAK